MEDHAVDGAPRVAAATTLAFLGAAADYRLAAEQQDAARQRRQ
jgi:prophage maintenance system killer protein